MSLNKLPKSKSDHILQARDKVKEDNKYRKQPTINSNQAFKTEKFFFAEEEDQENNNTNVNKHFTPDLNSEYEILEQINSFCGFKLYHIKILCCQFIQLFYYGFHMVTLNTVTLPYSKYMNFSMNQMKILQAILYLGAALGSASVAYQYKLLKSRKTLLRLNFLISLFFTYFFSEVNNYWLALLSRFIIGLTLGFLQPVHNNLSAEIIPSRYINFIMISMIASNILGNFVPLVFELVIMPTVDFRKIPQLMGSTALFYFILMLIFLVITEDSPKNYLNQKEKKKAFALLKNEIANNEQSINVDSLEQLILAQIDDKEGESLKHEGESYFAMFEKKYIWISLSNLSLISGHYYINYGLSSIQNIIAKQAADSEDIVNPTDEITNQIVLNMLSLIAPFLAALLSEFKSIGIKLTLTIGHICLALTFLLVFINRSNIITYISLANAVTSFNSCIIYCLIAQAFPINIKDKSVGITFLIGKSAIILSIIISLSLVNIFNGSINYLIYLILAVWNTFVMFMYPSPQHNDDKKNN